MDEFAPITLEDTPLPGEEILFADFEHDGGGTKFYCVIA